MTERLIGNRLLALLETLLLAVPCATAVYGYSMYGDADIYFLFQEGTDPYWAQ